MVLIPQQPSPSMSFFLWHTLQILGVEENKKSNMHFQYYLHRHTLQK